VEKLDTPVSLISWGFRVLEKGHLSTEKGDVSGGAEKNPFGASENSERSRFVESMGKSFGGLLEGRPLKGTKSMG
jgi:hypothetical protein